MTRKKFIKLPLTEIRPYERNPRINDDAVADVMESIKQCTTGDDIYKRRILLRRYMQMKRQARNMLELQQLERLEHLQQLERLERLETVEIKCGSYLDYKYQAGDVVYCDPPYENTAQYSSAFNSEKFYEWVYSCDYPVYFSSYQISDKRFKMIWAKGKVNLMAGAAGQKANYEMLYLKS